MQADFRVSWEWGEITDIETGLLSLHSDLAPSESHTFEERIESCFDLAD